MYRPSMYDKHDESMFCFADKFNKCKICRDVVMIPNEEETFDNDGWFVNVSNDIRIGFDWEYRDKYFSNCKLQFDTLGQYERKLRKSSIQIAIQCDSTETGIAVGWHEDWLKETKEKRMLHTDYKSKESGNTRYTDKYIIYRYEEIDQFKQMINMAMRLGVYSYKIFEMMKRNQVSTGKEFSASKKNLENFSTYIQENVICSECGKPMVLAKGSRGKCYLSGEFCKHIEYLTPNHVNRYIQYYKRLCPIHNCEIKSGLSKYGVYVRCQEGHFMNPDEI